MNRALNSPEAVAKRKASRKRTIAQLHSTRSEDVRWFAHQTSECAEEVARRLGMTHDALEQWCRRAHDDIPDHRAEWRILARRDPLPLDASRADDRYEVAS